LLSGALEQELTEEAQRLVSLFGPHRDLMREKARQAEAVAEARWTAKLKGAEND
jgi:recombinational DNA repair ATPase RecF